MEAIELFITLLVTLFTLYSLSRDDFVLLRKNISLDQIFNIATVALAIGVIAARVLYIVAHFRWGYFNPLVFLALPYFPGLSIIGGILGSLFYILYYTSYKKIHRERLFDFFNCALLTGLSSGYVVHIIGRFVRRLPIGLEQVIPTVLLIVLSVLFLSILVPRQRRGEIRDGHLGLLFLICFSACLLIVDLLSPTQKILPYVSLEGILSIVVFITCLIFLLKKEKKTIKFAKIRI